MNQLDEMRTVCSAVANHCEVMERELSALRNRANLDDHGVVGMLRKLAGRPERSAAEVLKWWNFHHPNHPTVEEGSVEAKNLVALLDHFLG